MLRALLLLPVALGAQDIQQAPSAPTSTPVAVELRIVRGEIASAFIAGARDTVDGHIARAIAHARRAVALAPNDAETHYWLAAALGKRALRTSFRTALKAATESYREAKASLALDSLHAGSHAVIGRFHEELSRYAWPTRVMLSAMSGESDVKSVSLAAAERAYRRAITLDPNMVMYRHDYGRFLIGVGRHAEAEEQARIARTLPDRSAADAWLRDNLSALIARKDAK